MVILKADVALFGSIAILESADELTIENHRDVVPFGLNFIGVPLS